MKIYSLQLVGTQIRTIREWNTGNPRADLDAALHLAEPYVALGCDMRVMCNGELVWQTPALRVDVRVRCFMMGDYADGVIVDVESLIDGVVYWVQLDNGGGRADFYAQDLTPL